MKTLILGLGNPILSDDSAGLRVAAALKKSLNHPDVTILETELGGLNLLEFLTGYDRAIIVDAIRTAQGSPGAVYQFQPASISGSRRINSTHSLNFVDSLELGRSLGLPLPREIIIMGIEAEDTNTFSEECTPGVRQAVSLCADRIAEMISLPL